MPSVASVVVATHNRSSGLVRLLDALAEQRAAAPDFEVVVVDDGSTDDTPAVLSRLARDFPVPLQVLRLEESQGPATARNLGWRAAAAPVVCFIDDDCVPSPGWLGALASATESVDVAQGRTIPRQSDVAHRGPFSHTMSVPEEDGFYSTCNIAYRRAVLEQVGGFDSAFRHGPRRWLAAADGYRPPVWGEDTDLAWRALALGASTAFVAEATVEHEIRPDGFIEHLHGLARRAGLAQLLRRHPGLRDRLPLRGYVRPPHLRALLLVAAVGWLVAAQSGAALLGALGALGWYAWGCRRSRMAPPTRAGWLPALPLILVADLVEVAVLLRASIRHRTLVL